jgi:type 1 glutamine amidotransferase
MAAFRVDVEREHPVTAGVESFEILDEAYRLELEPDAAGLLGTRDESGQRHPLGWTRRHGLGKVCYLALGHDVPQLLHPALSRLVENALSWFFTSAP